MGMKADAIAATLGGATQLVDELFTTKEERAAALAQVNELHAKGLLAQVGLNTEEAKSTNLFVSGWRPAVGWTCVSAFVLNFVVFPCVMSAAVYYSAFTGENVDLSALPHFDMGEMMPVLLGMLGLGGLRTVEKTKGVA